MKHLAKVIFLCLIASLSLKQALAQNLINDKLGAELAAISKEDQQYRVAAIAAAKKNGAHSQEDKDLMKQQTEADKVNLVKVEKIIATYGYPGKSMVGPQSKVVFMVVQHNDLEAQEKYLPLFIKAAESGELERTVIPLMIDRVRTGKGQPQLYGTQLFDKEDASIQIFPIEDEVNVNVRRKAAGLQPLEDYYKYWHVNYIVPTAAGNLNPKELYVNMEALKHSPFEIIGADIPAKLIYPEKARANNISGFVTVQYVIDKDGNTKNIEVIQGLGYGCDEEAIRVIKETKYNNKIGNEYELRMKLKFSAKKE